MRNKKRQRAAFDIRSLKVRIADIHSVRPDPKNPRDYTDEHIAQIGDSVDAFGQVDPTLIDENGVIIAGVGTWMACKRSGMREIAVIDLLHLSEAEKVALRIAHNRLTEIGSWNLVLLAENFEFLIDSDLEYDLPVTGYDYPEIDIILAGGTEAIKAAATVVAATPEEVELDDLPAAPVARLHDRFTFGDRHVIVCGDSTKPEVFKLALGTQRADLGVGDGPYNVPTARISGRGRTKHSDFIQGSGEMSPAQFQSFMSNAARQMATFCSPGAYICFFTAWYSLLDIILGCNTVFGKLAHICIWTKTNGGMGSPWRNAWEGLLVYRNKGGKTCNNVQLGKHGRNRTDVFNYAGANVFRKGRMEELKAHPTCKPVALLKDLILDVTPIGGIILDPFLGSGSAILAADEAGRRGVGIELDPRFVDVAILRIERAIGKPAMHDSGLTFAELKAQRAEEDF